MPFLLHKKDYAQALQLLQQYAPVDELATRHYQQYEIYKQLGKHALARQALSDAIAYLKQDINARSCVDFLYARHADWLLEQGDLSQALHQNSKAIALWPQFYGHRLQRAEIWARLGQPDKALAQLDALEKGSWHRLEHYTPAQKAKVYVALGRWQEAEDCYRQPTRCARTRYDNLCRFYTQQGRYSEIEPLRQAQRKEPRFQDRVSPSELQDLL